MSGHAPVHSANQWIQPQGREPCCAVAIHYRHYNFGRIHKSLRITHTMEAGIPDHVWTLEEIANLAY